MADIISERYALSLYEIAQDSKQEAVYLDELTAICRIMEQEPAFLKVLTTPSIPFEEKQNVLKTVFNGRIQPYLLNFLMLITEKGRVGLIADMCQAYKEQYYFENGIVEVLATSAKPISEPLQAKLKAKMEKVTGKTVMLQWRIDESLIGGLVVKVNNKQLDTSLRTRLNELAAQLTTTIA